MSTHSESAGSRLSPDEILQAVPVRIDAEQEGGLRLRHHGGEVTIAGVSHEELLALLAAIDGQRSASQVVDTVLAEGAWANTTQAVRRASTLLRELYGVVVFPREPASGAGERRAAASRAPVRPSPTHDPCQVRTVGILGGGTAGHLAALALRRKVPELEVTLIESPAVPIIGVGEATTPLMLQFLHQDLGLSITQLFAEVQPTLKLGIQFLWGSSGGFPYPFGPVRPLETHLYGEKPATTSLRGLLMERDALPLFRPLADDGEPAPTLADDDQLLARFGTEVAYHLDNARFATYLKHRSWEAGVRCIKATVERVETSPPDVGEPRVTGLITKKGRRLAFDLYIDASGFRSLLLGGALTSPWVSFASSLPANRAVIAAVPWHPGSPLRPYTTAETYSAGWCWSTPQLDADHRGYVYTSEFQTGEQAEAEMRRRNPAMGEARRLRFRTGRHEHFIRGNVVGLGNAYGFVEPLESTALHMLVRQIGLLVQAFPLRLPSEKKAGGALESLKAGGRQAGPGAPSLAESLNRRVGSWWDYLRWFLALHYRFNRRLSTPFWRFCEAEVDLATHGELLALYEERGPLSYWAESPSGSEAGTGKGAWADAPDPLWGPEGIDTILLGQGVMPKAPLSRAELAERVIPRRRWKERLHRARVLTRQALSQREALELFAQRPELLDELGAGFREAGPAFPTMHASYQANG